MQYQKPYVLMWWTILTILSKMKYTMLILYDIHTVYIQKTCGAQYSTSYLEI